MSTLHHALLTALATALLAALAGCASETPADPPPAEPKPAATNPPTGAPDGAGGAAATDGLPAAAEGRAAPDPNWPIKPYEDPHAVITLADDQTIVLELEKELAPKTVENFIRLAEQKFYDDTVFHRVLPGFMAQGGSPDGVGLEGPGWTIDLEIHPELRHTRGAVSMARKGNDVNSAGSQFFICYEAKSFLDDGYAVFARVVAGMDAAESLKKGSSNRGELRNYGMSDNEEGYPTGVKTVRIVDGMPAS